MGYINIKQQDCSFSSANLIYSTVDHSYYINDLKSDLLETCQPKITSGFENHLKCIDCFLAPIDRTTQLYSSYTPKLEQIKLLGGGSLIHEANVALNNLFNDAANKGLQLNVVSSYRSYDEQQKTFAFWVGYEIAHGATPAKALELTKVRVAPVGNSEHQLGTAVDIGCAHCDQSYGSAANKRVYDYLELNAQNFGFVLSYPKNSESITGYRYEPWHLRYIGVNLAQEFYQTGYTQGNGYLLSEFLKTKGFYLDD